MSDDQTEDAIDPMTLARLSENATLTTLARLSMLVTPPLIGVIGYLGVQYLDARFETTLGRVVTVEASINDTSAQIQRLSDKVETLDQRTTSIEAARGEARRNADTRNDQVLSRLDRLEGATNEVARQVAGLSAVLSTMRPRAER